MTKNIIIIRHAKSDWNTHFDDYHRPLNDRGKSDAPKMGKHLKSLGIVPDLIVSSSAIRTSSTAQLLALELGYPLDQIILNKSLYHASYKSILKELSSIDNSVQTLIVVGHNPGISDFLSYLEDADYELKTCCVAVLKLQVDAWNLMFQGTGVITNYISPREIEN